MELKPFPVSVQTDSSDALLPIGQESLDLQEYNSISLYNKLIESRFNSIPSGKTSAGFTKPTLEKRVEKNRKKEKLRRKNRKR